MTLLYRNLLVGLVITTSGFGMITTAQTVGSMTLASLSEEEHGAGAATSEFLRACIASLRTDIHACSVAVKKSKSKEIKSLAKEMIDQDEALLRRARALASKLEVSVLNRTEPDGQFESEVSNNNEADFDKEYTTYAIQDLEKNIEIFRMGTECDDRWVRAFASDNLSAIENQLIQFRSIASKSH